METRRESRIQQTEMVRIFGLDSAGKPVNLAVYTLDISHHGARLRDVNVWHAPGETVGVRCGTEKARYKIVWVGRNGTPLAGQVGLSSLEYGKYIFDVAPPGAEVQVESHSEPRAHGTAVALAPAPQTSNDRRHFERFAAEGGVRVIVIGEETPQWTVLHDISAGGCYVETTTPLMSDTPVALAVHVGGLQIEGRGHVTSYHRLVGMGIQFDHLTSLNRERLDTVLHALTQAQQN